MDLHLKYKNFLAYKNIVAKETVYRRQAIKKHRYLKSKILNLILTKLLFKWPFTIEIKMLTSEQRDYCLTGVKFWDILLMLLGTISLPSSSAQAEKTEY